MSHPMLDVSSKIFPCYASKQRYFQGSVFVLELHPVSRQLSIRPRHGMIKIQRLDLHIQQS